jgi:hypothetical protein
LKGFVALDRYQDRHCRPFLAKSLWLPTCVVESFLQEVGLVDVTDGVGFLSDRRSKGLDSDRAAIELVDYRCQDRAVHFVKATRVDLEQLGRAQGNFASHDRQLVDPSEIADAP